MKPHAMFFDEQYTEELYKSDTVRAYAQDKMDALIVVGTALQTSLAKILVNQALVKESVPVIEVNIESAILNGLCIRVEEGSETSLPKLVAEYKKITKV